MKHANAYRVVASVAIGVIISCALWGDALKSQGRKVVQDAGIAVGVMERSVPASATVMVGRDGSVEIDGKRVREPVATKTQVVDGEQTIAGTLKWMNQEIPGKTYYMGTSTWRTSFMAGGIYCTIEDITESGNLYGDPQPSPPAGTDYTLIAILESAGPMPIHHHEFYYIAAGAPGELELDFSISVTGFRLNRERSSSPGTGRDNSPVFAKETSIEDTWVLEPVSWDASFGGMTDSGDEQGDTGISGITYAWVYYWQKLGVTGYDYNSVSINWSTCDIDFSGLGKTVSPLRFTGSGDTLTMDVVTNFVNPPAVWSYHEIRFGRPYIKDFSNFAVFDRDGDLVDTLLINGGFVADPRFPWSANCPPA